MQRGTVVSARAMWTSAGGLAVIPHKFGPLQEQMKGFQREDRKAAGEKALREASEPDYARCDPSWASGTCVRVKQTFIIPDRTEQRSEANGR